MTYCHYKELFSRAIEATRSLGLVHGMREFVFPERGVSHDHVGVILGEFIGDLYRKGLSDSASLSGNCIQIHDQLFGFMERSGIQAHMTVGSMHGNGWSYCRTSIDQLKAELEHPDSFREIEIHTWLTLNDGSIIDCTGQAWYDMQIGEVHPVEKCLVYIPQGNQDPSHYYTPYIVGYDFLYRTGCISRTAI